jgi:NifB/MoaA-like Fe-S oxidoreductase
MLDPTQAEAVLATIERWQQQSLNRWGTRFVFGADELYLRAQRPLPPYAAYEDFSQIENGVGLIARFKFQAHEVFEELDPQYCGGVRATLVCGESARDTLEDFLNDFNHKAGTDLQLHVVKNSFWGESVSVSGLLTGGDIINSLKDIQTAGFDPGAAILLPEVMFKDTTDALLDDIVLSEMEERLGVEVKKIAADPWAVLDAVEEISALSNS